MQKTYPCNMKRSYIKRKHCLLKKAMEFSLKCDQEILLVVFDKKANQYVEYKSSDQFDLKMIKAIQGKEFASTLSRESYSNSDFGAISKNVSEREMQTMQKAKMVEPTQVSKENPLNKLLESIDESDSEEEEEIEQILSKFIKINPFERKSRGKKRNEKQANKKEQKQASDEG